MSHCLDPDVIDFRSLEIGGRANPMTFSQPIHGHMPVTTSNAGHFTHPEAAYQFQQHHHAMTMTSPGVNMSQYNSPAVNCNMSVTNVYTIPNPMAPTVTFPTAHVKSEFPAAYPYPSQRMDSVSPYSNASGYASNSPNYSPRSQFSPDMTANPSPAQLLNRKPPSFDFSKFAMMPAKAIDSIYAGLHPSYKPRPNEVLGPNFSIPSPVGYSKGHSQYDYQMDEERQDGYLEHRDPVGLHPGIHTHNGGLVYCNEDCRVRNLMPIVTVSYPPSL